MTTEYIHVEETLSTNTLVKQLAAEHSDATFLVVSADFQTAGRGQRGNSWESARGENLMFSLLCRPTFIAAREQFILSEAIALSVVETLDEYAEGFSIKWPNDIYWRDKKIAGILIENELGAAGETAQCVIGVGLNLNQTHFVSDAPNPISLLQVAGLRVRSRDVLYKVVDRFCAHFQQLSIAAERSTISDAYHRRLYRLSDYHPYRDAAGTFRARIVEVLPTGHLVLEDEAATRRTYAFKEVTFLLNQ